MDKNIKFLKDNLGKIISILNREYQEIWAFEYPLFSSNYKKDIKEDKVINFINNLNELVLYIHIPFCVNKCDYCTYYLSSDIKSIGSKKYVECLKKELDRIIKNSKKKKRILTILIGGGTPNLLDPNDLKDLMSYVHDNFDILPGTQISIEASPYNFNQEMAQAIIDSKITRLCLGVQTFNEEKLKDVNRPQKNKDVYNVVKYLRKAGNIKISFDLIYGLTLNETSKEFLKDNLKHIISLKPDAIELYPLQNYIKFPKAVDFFPNKDFVDIIKILNLKLGQDTAKSTNSDFFKDITIDNFSSNHSLYFYLRRTMAKNVIAVGFGANSNFWINEEFVSRKNKNRNLDEYKRDANKYIYFKFNKEEAVKRYIINNFSRKFIDLSVIKERFSNSSDFFNNTLNNIKKALSYSNNKVFLNDNYTKILPFKTKNDIVNYFIMSFCYLYSDSDRKKLIKKIQNYEK